MWELYNFKAYYFIIGLLFFNLQTLTSQNKKVADSLIHTYEENLFENSQKLELLKDLIEAVVNPDLRLKYASILIEEASKDSIYRFLLAGNLQNGHSYREKGNFALALEYYFHSLKLAEKEGDQVGAGIVLTSLADTYSEAGDSNNAQLYYSKGIQKLRITKDSLKLASALLNAGDHFLKDNQYDVALTYFEESGRLFEELNFLIGTAYNMGNMGMVYAMKGEHFEAKKNINKAISILENFEDYYSITEYLAFMSDIYLDQNDWEKSFIYTSRSLELSTKYGLKDQISAANLQLSHLYERKGRYKNAYNYFRDHIVYRDSVLNVASVKKMADLRTEYEVSQKQIEVDLLEKNAEISILEQRRQENIIYGIILFSILIFLLAYGLFRRYMFIKKTNRIIELEKKKSDELLLNILPEETALELKENGSVKARKFESVTVLFTDFEGFTKFAENVPPEELVKSVDYYFSKFDTIIEKYQLEKIKTIGDAYMCASGMHSNLEDHAYKMVLASLEIRDFVYAEKINGTESHVKFDVRIGVNTGPVVAGVVGTKKFAYDIWGDTVNTASRMESSSESGKINISQNTYNEVHSKIKCEFRGEISIKNRSAINMYFANDII